MGSRRQLLQKNTAYQQKMFKDNAYNTQMSTFKSLVDSIGLLAPEERSTHISEATPDTIVQDTKDHATILSLIYKKDNTTLRHDALANIHKIRKLNPVMAGQLEKALLLGKKLGRPNEGERKSAHSYTQFTSLEPMVSVVNVDQEIQFSVAELSGHIDIQEEEQSVTYSTAELEKPGDGAWTLYPGNLDTNTEEAKQWLEDFLLANDMERADLKGLQLGQPYNIPAIRKND